MKLRCFHVNRSSKGANRAPAPASGFSAFHRPETYPGLSRSDSFLGALQALPVIAATFADMTGATQYPLCPIGIAVAISAAWLLRGHINPSPIHSAHPSGDRLVRQN